MKAKSSGVDEYERHRRALRQIDVLYVNVFVIRVRNGAVDFLLLKRREDVPLPGVWQPVSGKIREGESIKEAFGRQVSSKTGLKDFKLYRTDAINIYYDDNYDSILAVPFALALTEESEIHLDRSLHEEFTWASGDKAVSLMPFNAHRTFLSEVNASWRDPKYLPLELDNKV